MYCKTYTKKLYILDVNSYDNILFYEVPVCSIFSIRYLANSLKIKL